MSKKKVTRGVPEDGAGRRLKILVPGAATPSNFKPGSPSFPPALPGGPADEARGFASIRLTPDVDDFRAAVVAEGLTAPSAAGNSRRPTMSLQDILTAVPGLIPDLAWLGRQKDWIVFEPYTHVGAENRGVPGTKIKFWPNRLEKCPGYEGHRGVVDVLYGLYERGDWEAIAIVEAIGALYAWGPKRFAPTEEQFESMEQVELRMPIADLRMPYDAIVVTIPPKCRERLAREHGLNVGLAARNILVRLRREPGQNPVVITSSGEAGTGQENFYLMQHQEGNPTVEVALGRLGCSRPKDGLFAFGHVVCRASLNLGQMLTHFGSRVELPRPPAGQKLNRAQRRAQTHHGDWSTIHMKQEIVIRQHKTDENLNAPGLGTGTEVKPHWRKGCWAAYPGTAKLRLEGKEPPLLFRRPCLVRADRVVGDLKDTEATYRG